MIGETISHYRITEKLGQGGMGEVYLAEDTRLGHQVAIKRLPAAMASDRNARTRFRREAQAVAQLRHSNIVSLLEFDEVDGEYVLIMEYVCGGSLRDKLAAGPPPLEFALRWAVQTAEGLADAHRQGVLHRDIKPENLLLTEDGDLRITDFGLARLEDATRMTEAGSTMGTLAYTAPEQARGEEVDERADLFSLGATLYELLAGRSAFASSTRAATLRAVLDDTPEPVSELRQDLPAGLQELLHSLLKKDTSERPRSAREVSDALRSIAAEVGFGDTMPLPSAASARRPASARPRPTLLITATAVVLVAVISALWMRGQHAPMISSLAVLPLASVSERSDQDYLAAGMTEALIQELGKIEALKVISHQSVRRFRESDQPLPEIARELKVAAILEGSVMQFGDEVHISVRVSDVDADQLLVNEEFDGSKSEVLRLYGRVATAIADGIRLSLTPDEQQRLSGQREVDPEAYALYLRGRLHWDRWTSDEILVAIDHFERAVAIDSTFAAPYASLASIYSELNLQSETDPVEAADKGRQAAARALELDPTLAEAHASMGRIVYYFDWDFARAERHFQRAIELNPSSSEAHYQYATFLTFAGRNDESVTLMSRAVELDPMSHRRSSNLGWALIHARRFDEAIEHLRGSLDLYAAAPDSTHEWWAHYLLTASYRRAGRYEEAIAENEAWNVGRAELASTYFAMGRTSNAIDLFESMGDPIPNWLVAGSGKTDAVHARVDSLRADYAAGAHGRAMELAVIYSILDEKELAFDWLERAYEARVQGVLLLSWANWVWDNLREDPRYEDLLARIQRGK